MIGWSGVSDLASDARLDFGKFRENADRGRPPSTPVRLHDHGDEADAGSLAIKLGVVVLPLVVFVLRHGCRRVVYDGVHQVATKA